MSKIRMEFDTSSKELSVSLDGITIDNIQSVSVCKGGYYSEDSGGDDYCLSLMALDKKDDAGYKTYTQIVAKDSSEGREFQLKGASTFNKNPEFLCLSGVSSKLQKEIFNFLNRKK